MRLLSRVEDILSGKVEADKVLHNNPCQSAGYVILPDMKWDLTTLSSLYLIAITRSKSISSLRELRRKDLGMLRSIRREAARVVKERWGLDPSETRLFIHYQPSYCELPFLLLVVSCSSPLLVRRSLPRTYRER